ncbi:efflux RND transporter permease subunit [Spirochaeta cellobiosiphila]|uniref:efflux RND transporter permease subunit n=1 Tax=Spirochaeta cellobiosiphila TaxID=504483 RepID=UPI0003FDD488|nr:efflux RND transporter permease subunit [Spirochaeta cellobiosiphila]
MSFGKFSVKNPVFINILMVCLLILGGLSLVNLPRQQYADVPFYWVNITVPYPGVAAEDVERSVTIPIENAFNNMKKVDEVESATSEGFSLVRVKMENGISKAEFERLYQEVQTRFNKVNLPSGVLEGELSDFSTSDFLPVIEVMILGQTELRNLNVASEELKEKIEQIQGVSDVTAVGLGDKEIQIDLDLNRMEALKIPLSSVVTGLEGYNMSIPGGSVISDSREYLLRTIGELNERDDFGDIVIRRSEVGRLTLRDIASIREGYSPDAPRVHFNGIPGIALKVAKREDANSIDLVKQIKLVSSQYEKQLAPPLSITYINDSTIPIRDSLNVLLSNSLFGFILLIVILYIFIGFRNALITGLGIPLTFAVTFLVLDMLGETLNSNTLFGLVLVLGMIVDHAIVIIENSYRLRQQGLTSSAAAIKGTDQVVIPVIAASATTIAAFLPLMLLPGVIGKFLRVIPLVVTIALIVSTGEALIFLPSHFAEWSSKPKPDGKIFQKVQEGLSRFLDYLYGHKKIFLSIIVGISIAIFSCVPFLKQDLFSAEDFTLFYIDVEMPAGTTMNGTSDVVRKMEKLIIPRIGNGEVLSVTSFIGYRSGSSENISQSNIAQIMVDLSERKEGRKRSITQIMTDVKNDLLSIPGPSQLIVRKAQNGPPVDPPLAFRLRGNSFEQLQELTQDIKSVLWQNDNLYNVKDSLNGGTPELQIRLKKDQAALYGLSPITVGRYLNGIYGGTKVTEFFRDNEEVDVILSYDTSFRNRPEDLLTLGIPLGNGSSIPLSSIAVIEEDRGIGTIDRVDGSREVVIDSQAYEESLVPSVNKEILDMWESKWKSEYPDVNLIQGGEFAQFSTLLYDILRIFLVGIFLIYLILGSQFNSYFQPFMILLTIPFAFAGVILYLIVSGTPFSTTVLYAGVALAGIAVNDSIVLISFINDLRSQGHAVAFAVKEAVSIRLRPILLTSITTIAGLLPTALGLGGRSVVWSPMASTIIFGLIFSTFTALVIIPLSYGLFNEKKLTTKDIK